MIEISENETTTDLNGVGKKEWVEPQMMQLNVKETKGGNITSNSENEWWDIFNIGHS